MEYVKKWPTSELIEYLITDICDDRDSGGIWMGIPGTTELDAVKEELDRRFPVEE